MIHIYKKTAEFTPGGKKKKLSRLLNVITTKEYILCSLKCMGVNCEVEWKANCALMWDMS